MEFCKYGFQDDKKLGQGVDDMDRQSKMKFLLTSCVVAALITGIISLIVSFNNNARLKEIETQKHQYDLQMIKYEKLQEALLFFTNYQFIDYEFI